MTDGVLLRSKRGHTTSTDNYDKTLSLHALGAKARNVFDDCEGEGLPFSIVCALFTCAI